MEAEGREERIAELEAELAAAKGGGPADAYRRLTASRCIPGPRS
jgi:hypothetical protein